MPIRSLTHRTGRRRWSIAVVDAVTTRRDLECAASTGEWDVLVVSHGVGEAAALANWASSREPGGWSASVVAADSLPGDVREAIEASSAGTLLIGPAHLVTGFASACGAELGEPIPYARSINPRVRGLPNPGDVPPFPQEATQDPFGINKEKRDVAWNAIATALGAVARNSHQNGFAVTLPEQVPGHADHRLKPWTTVVPVVSPRASAFPGVTGDEQLSDATSVLALLQRWLLLVPVLADAEPNAWQGAAETLQQFGYLLVAREPEADDRNRRLDMMWHIGMFLALVHRTGYLHGDPHLGDFRYQPDKPVGERLAVFDLGNMFVLLGPARPVDRAQDLAILKTQAPYLDWEAAKVGYRSVAGDIADAVFKLI